MRIISGTKRGIKLNTLEGNNTRPTLDRVKESLFDILYSKYGNYDVVLDLFSGSGSLGLETISRGSKFVYLCDNSKEAIDVIKSNMLKCKFELQSEALYNDYVYCLKIFKEKKITFDLIFLDPPYGKGLGIESLKLIDEYGLLKENGIIVLEEEVLENIPNNVGSLDKIDERKYGRIKIYFYVKGA